MAGNIRMDDMAIYVYGTLGYDDISVVYKFICRQLQNKKKLSINFGEIVAFNTSIIVLICELLRFIKERPQFEMDFVDLPEDISNLARLYNLDCYDPFRV